MIFGSYFRRLKQKMVREPLPAETIAAGWALGMFVGCAVPFGLQLAVSIPLAMMMRVSKIGATMATFITNPVTIIFIYPAQTYFVNRYLFGGSLSFEKLMDTEWTWDAVCKLGSEAMASFFLGGIFLGMVLSPLTYFAVKYSVLTYRRKREGMMQKSGTDRIK